MMLLALLCAAVCGCGRTIPTDGSLSVIPRPASIEATEGTFVLTPRTNIVLSMEQPGAEWVADAINRMVEPLFGRALAVRTTPASGAVTIRTDASLAAEAYRLEVRPDGIEIAAGAPAGAFYAVQTLRQLLPVEAFGASDIGRVELPCAVVADAPCMGYRGVMLDASRHFFTVDEVKQLLDIVAMHKINTFHWHLTDDQGWRIEIKAYPELTRVGSIRKRTLIGRDPGGEYDETCQYDETPYGGFYTQDEIRDVVAYAAERFITVIPEIEFPGHAVSALASYPWLSCTGEQYEVRQTWDIDDRVFCPGKETTFEFIEGVLAEVVELFPGEYVHIGGDECPMTYWKKCPHCKARMRSEGLTEWRQLQNYSTARLERFLNAHGKKLIGWDEILEGEVTPTATIMSWRGTEGGIRAAKQGNYAIMAPSEYCYFDHAQAVGEGEPLSWGARLPVDKVYSFDPYEGLTPEERHYILGMQANLWAEYIPNFDHLQYMLLPRLGALCETAWACDRKEWSDFRRRLDRMARLYDAYGYNYAKHLWAE